MVLNLHLNILQTGLQSVSLLTLSGFYTLETAVLLNTRKCDLISLPHQTLA